jgi:hypothetical protein
MSTIYRAPNENGKPKESQTEVDIMLEEFAYSTGFKLFLNEIVTPIVVEIRSTLLRVSNMTDPERNGLVARLDMLERLLDDLYGRTADGVMPEPLKNFFK